MAAIKAQRWRKLPLSLAELCIDTTLRCGQSFRWLQIEDEWHCSLHGRVVSLRQDATHLYYRATWPQKRSPQPQPSLLTPPTSVRSEDHAEAAAPGMKAKVEEAADQEDDAAAGDDTEALLRHYFNLSLSLSDLYRQWSDADANFRRKAPKFTGVRILNQNAWEALVAFICSSNNNIARISQMVHKLCDHYGGDPIATVGGHVFRDFPGPEALAGDGVEARLRELGFGYRARYIADTARAVARDRPVGWLHSLRNPASPPWASVGEGGPTAKLESGLGAEVKIEREYESGSEPVSAEDQKKQPAGSDMPSYRASHAALLELAGVGPKVADCACLMGLGWGEAVPLDTHMLTIAARDYRLDKRAGKSNSLSKAMYDAVGDHFRALWGPQAGWAQSVLFTANLRAFADRLSDKGGGAKAEAGEGENAAVFKLKVETEQKTATKRGVMTTTRKTESSGLRGKRKVLVSEVQVDDGATRPDPMPEALGDVVRRSKRRRQV